MSGTWKLIAVSRAERAVLDPDVAYPEPTTTFLFSLEFRLAYDSGGAMTFYKVTKFYQTGDMAAAMIGINDMGGLIGQYTDDNADMPCTLQVEFNDIDKLTEPNGGRCCGQTTGLTVNSLFECIPHAAGYNEFELTVAPLDDSELMPIVEPVST